jgi:SnoaL-like protein
VSMRALILAATVAAVALAGCGGSDDDPRNAAAARFVEAVNAGSTDRVMETLTEDAVVIDSGRRFADPDSIREWVDSEVTGVDGRIAVRDERATDEGVVLTVDFESSGFSGTDLRYTFTTRGERVADLTLGGA